MTLSLARRLGWPKSAPAPTLPADLWPALAARGGSALRAPVEAAALDAAEARLEFAVPPTLRAAYLHFDGEHTPGLFAALPKEPIRGADARAARWLSLAEALDARTACLTEPDAPHHSPWFALGAGPRSTIWVFPPDERMFVATKRRLEPLGLTVAEWLLAAAGLGGAGAR
jgi:hypothetical protein